MLSKLKDFWSQLREQTLTFYGGLTTGRKFALMTLFLIIFFVFGLMLYLKPVQEYELAYSNLSAEDKISILAHLKKQNIKEYKLEGDSISFPSEQIHDIRMMLAEEGLPSTGIGVGWERFDDRTFGMSDFDQRINKIRALQGELSRTINRLDPVMNSRVHIVLPESAVFAEDKKITTASIFLRLKPGKTISQRQIQGIIHLVARGVEGLDGKQITIVDQDGNLLTEPEEQDGGLDKVTSTQRDYQKKVEKELELKIREILVRVVGHDKVVAKVQADIDFKKVETTISDVDPERTAVIASQRNEQSMQGSGLNPTGVPGAKSNLPGEKEDIALGSSGTQSKSNSENLNFEVKKTLSKIIEPVGTIKKITASVLVDGKIINEKFELRSAQEIEMMTKLVKTAIGFVENRDAITVESTQFELTEFEKAEKATVVAKQGQLLQTGILAVLAIAFMFFIYFAFVKPYFRWLTHDPDKRSEEQFAVMDYELSRTSNASRKIQMKEEVPFDKMTPREQILYLARNDPKKTTEAIRQLISPHH